MEAGDVLEEVAAESWDGPFDDAIRARALAALEDGRVVYLPRLRFALQGQESAFLDVGALDASRKNITFDPATGRCHGTAHTGERLAGMVAMLDRFGRQAEGLLQGLVPAYAPYLQRARASFRPAEIRGRNTSPRHDDRRLHVDAFPTRPTSGRRILRVFTNVAPQGVPREWRVGEPFPVFARAFLPRVRRPLPGELWAMHLAGLTKGRRSRYDHLMLGLHDAAKLDTAYQSNAPAADVAFPPGSTWLCFTDAVLHAAMSGHGALEQTFHLPVEAMAAPEKSPIRVLERLSGQVLA